MHAQGGVVRAVVLDGVAEDPDKFVIDWDEAMDANLAAVIATQDAVIPGRRSYAEWSEFWPGSEIEPFATFINDVAKYVASSAAGAAVAQCDSDRRRVGPVRAEPQEFVRR